jgi:hypothetical protein
VLLPPLKIAPNPKGRKMFDCASPFNDHQRAKLKSLSRVKPKGEDYPVTPNKALDEYIATLKELNPHMFQTKESMKERVFVDEPSTSVYKRSIRTYAESPHRIIPV